MGTLVNEKNEEDHLLLKDLSKIKKTLAVLFGSDRIFKRLFLLPYSSYPLAWIPRFCFYPRRSMQQKGKNDYGK